MITNIYKYVLISLLFSSLLSLVEKHLSIRFVSNCFPADFFFLDEGNISKRERERKHIVLVRRVYTVFCFLIIIIKELTFFFDDVKNEI